MEQIIGHPLESPSDKSTDDTGVDFAFGINAFVCRGAGAPAGAGCGSVGGTHIVSIKAGECSVGGGMVQHGWHVRFKCELCDREWVWFFWQE